MITTNMQLVISCKMCNTLIKQEMPKSLIGKTTRKYCSDCVKLRKKTKAREWYIKNRGNKQ